MRIIKNFQQFLGESEDEPIQFTTSTLGRAGEIELDDYEDEDEYQGGAEDHEVGMAQNLLDDIIKNATELKQKIGNDEMNLPGWIQDHISQSQNYINQANTGYHELSEAAHIDMDFVNKEIKKFNSRHKNTYYAILPVSDLELDGFFEYCDEKGIESFDLNDEYPTDYLFIHNDENVLDTFIKKYWDENDIKKYWDENDMDNENIINKYQK